MSLIATLQHENATLRTENAELKTRLSTFETDLRTFIGALRSTFAQLGIDPEKFVNEQGELKKSALFSLLGSVPMKLMSGKLNFDSLSHLAPIISKYQYLLEEPNTSENGIQ